MKFLWCNSVNIITIFFFYRIICILYLHMYDNGPLRSTIAINFAFARDQLYRVLNWTTIISTYKYRISASDNQNVKYRSIIILLQILHDGHSLSSRTTLKHFISSDPNPSSSNVINAGEIHLREPESLPKVRSALLDRFDTIDLLYVYQGVSTDEKLMFI